MHSLIDKSYAKFLSSVTYRVRCPTGDKSNPDTSAHKQRNPLAVADVKLLGFDTVIVDHDPTVSEHAVDVEKQQLNPCRLAANCNANSLHGEIKFLL